MHRAQWIAVEPLLTAGAFCLFGVVAGMLILRGLHPDPGTVCRNACHPYPVRTCDVDAGYVGRVTCTNEEE